MSFSFDDHVTNRGVSITLNHFLDQTLGNAIRFAADWVELDQGKANQLSRHAVGLAQAGLDGIRGNRFDSLNAARSFLTSELNSIVQDHFEQAGNHYAQNNHRMQEAINLAQNKATQELIVLISSYLGQALDTHRQRHA